MLIYQRVTTSKSIKSGDWAKKRGWYLRNEKNALEITWVRMKKLKDTIFFLTIEYCGFSLTLDINPLRSLGPAGTFVKSLFASKKLLPRKAKETINRQICWCQVVLPVPISDPAGLLPCFIRWSSAQLWLATHSHGYDSKWLTPKLDASTLPVDQFFDQILTNIWTSFDPCAAPVRECRVGLLDRNSGHRPEAVWLWREACMCTGGLNRGFNSAEMVIQHKMWM